MPDTPANATESGVTGKDGVNHSGNPQVRLMAPTECGTHALSDAAVDAVATFSEHKPARCLLAPDARACCWRTVTSPGSSYGA